MGRGKREGGIAVVRSRARRSIRGMMRRLGDKQKQRNRDKDRGRDRDRERGRDRDRDTLRIQDLKGYA
jgi:hypothetical protein